ncbi:MAG: restriction endonuclease subunit S, partial [Spirochaetota bacterium]|nr:restriction endonuclease subunit S [Spirochaetota bacterium]
GNIDEGCINLNSDNVFVNKSLVSENQIIKKNDVIIVTSTGSIKVIGRAGVSASDYEDVAFGAFLTLARPNEKANKSFVNQYFQSSLYRERIRQLASGVNINNIRIEYITESPFPLPPTLAEQQRIVKRIESMFAKLDEAKEKAQNVVDGFETRKAAILHKAFTGELTAKWRKENGVSDDSWVEKTVGDCCTSLKYGTAKKSESSGKVAVIRMGNLQHGEIEYDDLVFSNDEEDIKKYSLSKGDVLFNRTNSPEWVGKTSIYRGDIPAIYAGYLIKLDYEKSLLVGDYLNYVLNSPNAKEYCNSVKTDGVNQSNINAQKIGAYVIPVPTLPEQVEIVRILDIIIEKENKAKQAAEAVLEQIDLLKKSILARAFRGEL